MPIEEERWEWGSIGEMCSPQERNWRRGPGSNRRIKVLQTSPLPLGYRALGCLPHGLRIVSFHSSPSSYAPEKCRMERETRLELATLALARRCSTTELLPLNASSSIPGCRNWVKRARRAEKCFSKLEFRDRVPARSATRDCRPNAHPADV